MQFQPKTEKELNDINLIAPGIYPFEVFDAKPRLSKSGNEMIELSLRLWLPDGTERQMYDYLLPQMAHKLKHFCDVTFMEAKYQSGTLTAEDCLWKRGRCEINVQKGKANPAGGMYPDRNAVKDYVPTQQTPMVNAPHGSPLQQPAQPAADFPDDVPW